MAKESTFGNMVVSLTVICLVCSAILGCVYVLTEKKIDDANIAKQNASIAAVCPEFDNDPYAEKIQVAVGDKNYNVYTAKKAGETVAYAIEVAPSGFGGAINMMVGYTIDGTIFNTSVVSCSETPGLGAKILDETSNPRAGVKGLSPKTSKMSVKKDGGDIDAITASTITSRAFLKGVEESFTVFETIAGESLDSVSGATKVENSASEDVEQTANTEE